MSRKIPRHEYEKTLSFRLKQWFEGTKDPFLNTVEMKPQTERQKDEDIDWKRKREKRQRIEAIYDLAHNWEIRSFQKFYKVFSGLFCLFLVAMLLIAVSYLPSYGHPENPANNEVARRYIESGLEETGAVNIVTGRPNSRAKIAAEYANKKPRSANRAGIPTTPNAETPNRNDASGQRIKSQAEDNKPGSTPLP